MTDEKDSVQVIYLVLERIRTRVSGPRLQAIMEDEEPPITREAAE